MALIEMLPDDPKLAAILSYPRFKEDHYRGVLMDLEDLGITGIVSQGNFEVGGLKVVGKGCVGIVCAGRLEGEVVAIKVLRADANRESMLRESQMLAAANSCGVGPRLISSKGRVLVMELVRGLPILGWLAGRPPALKAKRAVGSTLRQAFSLDMAGIDHGELSNASKHIMADGSGKIWIIDFETASVFRKVRNFTSLLSFFFFKERPSAIMEEYLSWNRKEIASIIREYKGGASEALFNKALCTLGLD